MMNTSLSTYNRFRKVLLHAEENGDDLTPRLESRLNRLLDQTDTDDEKEQTLHAKAYLRIMPKIRKEICETLVDDIILQLDEFEDDEDELEIFFDPYLYAALTSCIEKGVEGQYTWDIDDDGDYQNLLKDENLDWQEVVLEGGGTSELVDVLEEFDFELSHDVKPHYATMAQSDPVRELTEEEKTCRPLGSEIEPKIERFLLENYDSGRNCSQQKFEMEVCKAMIAHNVDPAFIYAFQKVRVFVTQENSHHMDKDTLARWDDYVKDYRSIEKK